jgi:ribulose-phosphate 3-epimerase
MPYLSPSILGADFARLGEEIASAERAGVSYFHLDIMDGHFVPNISFGPGVVKTIDRLTDRFLEVHLMLAEPEKYFEPFVQAGADALTFHLEVHADPTDFVSQIRALHVEAGVSINPDMPVDKVLPYLEQLDWLLIMSVYPGFGGQKFIRDALSKIEAARGWVDRHGLTTKIAVDGGVDAANAGEIIDAGADVLVMGTAFFKARDRAELVRYVRDYKAVKS